MTKFSSGAALAATLLFFGLSQNVSAQNLAPALLECRNITDAADRLDCFDKLAGSLDEQAVLAAQEQAPEPGDEEAAPVLTAEQSFGLEDLPSEQKKKREEKTESLTASVVDIGRNGRGKYVIILENGQVWRQLTADTSKLRVPRSGAEGISVEIKRKMFGAHMLSLDGDNRSIKVERIK